MQITSAKSSLQRRAVFLCPQVSCDSFGIHPTSNSMGVAQRAAEHASFSRLSEAKRGGLSVAAANLFTLIPPLAPYKLLQDNLQNRCLSCACGFDLDRESHAQQQG